MGIFLFLLSFPAAIAAWVFIAKKLKASGKNAAVRHFAGVAAGFFVWVFVIMIGITCLNIKEKSTVDLNAPSVKQMFRALVSNDQAMTVVITIVLINCSLYITSNLLIYFFKYDIGGTNWNDSYVLFNTFGGAIQILSMMIYTKH